ncbi:MAG: AtpZ/AtpI family protein [Rhodobacteraceae bacterium]|nr:AtpZ/AtpI family protein [Paracoccaceae bacterium]
MKNTTQSRRLSNLGDRIKSLQTNEQPGFDRDHPANQAHVAWRMVIDLVAGIGVGVAVGFGLDHLFGTLPVLMVIFTLTGLAAGVNLMLRTAKEVSSAEREKSSESDGANPGQSTGQADRGTRGDACGN